MTQRYCDYEGSDYQNVFWEEGGRAYEDRAERAALKHLLPTTGKRMLELGAGAGRLTNEFHMFDEVVLMDYSFTQMQQARARLGDAAGRYKFIAADVYSLPFAPGLFDAAQMVRVIHHLEEPHKAMAQIRAVLQPNSAFILEYANKQNLKAMLRYAFGKQDWSPYTLEQVEFVAMNFDFHPKSVKALLAEADFSVRNIRTVSHFRAGFLKRAIPTGLLVALDRLASTTGNLVQVTPSVFVRSDTGNNGATAPADQFFRCPACGSVAVTETESSVDCNADACGKQWPIKDGIYDFKTPVGG